MHRLAREMRLPVEDEYGTMTREDADKVRTLYNMTGGTLPSHQPPEVIPGFTPGTIEREYDPVTAAIERNLGVPRRKRRQQPPTGPRYRPAAPLPPSGLPPRPRFGNDPFGVDSRPRRRPQPPAPAVAPTPGPRPSLTGAAAAAAMLWPHMPDTVARAVAASWDQRGFTEAQTIAWWKGGVQFGFPDTARELTNYGVEPHHLELVIRKETVGDRIRDGRLNPRQVAELLEREGHLRGAG